ncbi:hypothetical protein AB3504_16455 [Acinetobacter baumannii]
MRPALESNIDSVTETVAAKLKKDILGDIN